jgi:FkbM family methyltransferase
LQKLATSVPTLPDRDPPCRQEFSDLNAIARLDAFFRTHPLTRAAPYRAWARFVAWQIRSRIQSEVIVPWIGATRLAARRGMAGATGNIYVGLHEFADMMLPLHFLRPGDLFLDIGANIGSYTVLAAGVCGARSWAFEPHPGTAESLLRNVEINSLASLVRVHQCALGRAAGAVSFTSDEDSTNRVTDRNTGLTVRMEALDNLIGAETPAMIKMDVEGSEEEAIIGADATLAKPSLKLIAIETVTPRIREVLARHGFEEYHYAPFTRTLDPGPAEAGSCNRVFVRDLAHVRSRLNGAKPISVLGYVV